MRFWKRRADRDLEASLRGTRPAPRPEVSRAITGQLDQPRGGFVAGIGRLPFTLAGGLTAVVLIAVIALGGVSSPLDAASKALDLQQLKALQPNVHYGVSTPNANQYGRRVNVCVGGFVQIRLYAAEADALVGHGLVVSGPCSSAVTPPKGKARDWVCLAGYIELRLSPAQISALVGNQLVTPGLCPGSTSAV